MLIFVIHIYTEAAKRSILFN